MTESYYKIALAGNPNVGKSTVFNIITGMNQHTGNWTGKTVSLACGSYLYQNKTYEITDLPGTYSIRSYSREEEVAGDYLRQNHSDCVIIVANANALERSLVFAMQALSLNCRAVLCLNLCDEAERNGVFIDEQKLSRLLGIPVVKCCAIKKQGVDKLKRAVADVCSGKLICPEFSAVVPESKPSHTEYIRELSAVSAAFCRACVTKSGNDRVTRRTRKLDKLLTSKLTGIPIMLLVFALLFWITVVGANYPSQWLSILFSQFKGVLSGFFDLLNAPVWLKGILTDGVYTTLSWVVSVMLPPMAIFFPLFSLIEDSGYLPRIAFNLDRSFAKCGTSGKQSLTMAMGIGCNACGVTGCRILERKSERQTAIVTNSFMPCNGRFPILIAITMAFFTAQTDSPPAYFKVTAVLLIIISAAVLLTLAVSKLLTSFVYKGGDPGFALELPPYRKPQVIKTIARSLTDRTLKVLGRAAIVAAPAGAVIWLTANLQSGGVSLLDHITELLEPFGTFIGLDGVVLAALLLGFPANEIVIPVMVMAYMSGTTLQEVAGYGQLHQILVSQGWTAATAVCMLVITVLHFPCSTTCLTIYKETGSIKTTAAAFLLPASTGVLLCALISHIACWFGF